MIKINLKGKEFKSGKIEVEGTVEAGGPGNVLEAEIYGILKTFERDVTGPFGNALERLMDEALDDGSILNEIEGKNV